MVQTELKRPERKISDGPLKEEDKYYFLPYATRGKDILPSQVDTWKTDARAQAFVKALKAGEDLSNQDFTGINLKGADLSGFNLAGYKLSKSNLTGVDFSGSDLKGADLSYAYLENVNFTDADLRDINFKGVFYRNCNLTNAQIDSDDLAYLETFEWLLNKIETGEIDITSIPVDQLNMIDLRMLDLTHVDLEDVDLSPFILTGVNLTGTVVNKTLHRAVALFEKEKDKFRRTRNLSMQAMIVMAAKIAEERMDQIKSYAAAETAKKQIVRPDALKQPRPKKKEKYVAPKSDEDLKTSAERTKETHTANAKDASGKEIRHVDRKERKVRVPKTNLRKRA